MATIIELKQHLQDVQNELKNAVIKGGELANNKTTQLEDMQKQCAVIEDLQIREALLKQDLSRMENEGKPAQAKTPAQKSGFKSFGEFAQAVRNSSMPGNYRDERLVSFKDSATGQNETTSADGGYLVPPEYADGVRDLVKTESVLYPQARKVTITSNRLIENYINETSRVDPSTGSRHGGILAYWKAEAAQYAAVKAAIGERTTNVEKLTAYVPVTEELLEDAPAIESMINDLVAREFAFKVDDMIINGAGSSNVPLGILAGGGLVTVAKESGQAAATINIDNILKMRNALIAQCRKGAKWYINQDVEMALFKLALPNGFIASNGSSAVEEISGTFGNNIYQWPGQYGNADGMMLGMPVIPIEQCAALGTKGDIILADMSQYLIVEKAAGITRQVSMHIRFDYDESVFKFSWRLGGRPDWGSAITPYKGSTARSPYVALATRS
ncbi:MAG: phage major capsid protein [Clostridiales bacterium]|nr:phage major capsid protein [Clostridiales bacterium]